jgi:predicted O-methyltransferase YrrM
MNLTDIANKYNNQPNTDKGNYHGYLPIYNKLFTSYQNKCTFCEIGVAKGYSFRMWDEYFGDNSILYGVDINLSYIDAEIKNKFSNKIKLIESDVNLLHLTILNNLKFDLIIDDGSHVLEHQIKTIDFFLTRMNPGGLIIIEDVNSQNDLEYLRNLYGNFQININIANVPNDRLFIIIC